MLFWVSAYRGVVSDVEIWDVTVEGGNASIGVKWTV